jgi:hypothetical protein
MQVGAQSCEYQDYHLQSVDWANVHVFSNHSPQNTTRSLPSAAVEVNFHQICNYLCALDHTLHSLYALYTYRIAVSPPILLFLAVFYIFVHPLVEKNEVHVGETREAAFKISPTVAAYEFPHYCAYGLTSKKS